MFLRILIFDSNWPFCEDVLQSFKMAIATLCDWQENLAPVLSTNETQNQNHSQPCTHCTHDFSRASRKSQITARNSDWLFVPVVIGRTNYFGFGFSFSVVYSWTDVILSMLLVENCAKEVWVLLIWCWTHDLSITSLVCSTNELQGTCGLTRHSRVSLQHFDHWSFWSLIWAVWRVKPLYITTFNLSFTTITTSKKTFFFLRAWPR